MRKSAIKHFGNKKFQVTHKNIYGKGLSISKNWCCSWMGRGVIRDLELGHFLQNSNFEGALQENDAHFWADFW